MIQALIDMQAVTVRFSACLAALLAATQAVGAQGRPLTVEELRAIYASSDESLGWGEHHVPEFVAAAYGPRAQSAVLAILAEPSTRENNWFQALALATAEYGRVQVPAQVLMAYATGQRAASIRGTLRQRALYALSMRADAALGPFWIQLFREQRDASFRQIAPAGLACAMGTGALPDLELMRRDSHPWVARVAEFYHAELTSKGEGGLACGGRVTRAQASGFPEALHPYLRERAETMLERIP